MFDKIAVKTVFLTPDVHESNVLEFFALYCMYYCIVSTQNLKFVHCTQPDPTPQSIQQSPVNKKLKWKNDFIQIEISSIRRIIDWSPSQSIQ